jgi:hypothetical protein
MAGPLKATPSATRPAAIVVNVTASMIDLLLLALEVIGDSESSRFR